MVPGPLAPIAHGNPYASCIVIERRRRNARHGSPTLLPIYVVTGLGRRCVSGRAPRSLRCRILHSSHGARIPAGFISTRVPRRHRRNPLATLSLSSASMQLYAYCTATTTSPRARCSTLRVCPPMGIDQIPTSSPHIASLARCPFASGMISGPVSTPNRSVRRRRRTAPGSV